MRSSLLATAATASLAAPFPVNAGGMVIPGAGPPAQPRAGAFVARADDASTVAHNPAGFAKLDGTSVTIGGNFIDLSLRYQRLGAYEPSAQSDAPDYEGQPFPAVEDRSRPTVGLGGFQLLPLFAVATDLGHPEWPVRFGAGLFTPNGYVSREFPETHQLEGAVDPAPGPQRYDIMEQQALLLQPSLAVAYSPIPGLDVGARVSWGWAQIEGKKTLWGIRNYEEYEGRDSVFTLEGARDNFVPGFSLGALYRPSPSLEIGAAYNSQLNVHAVGRGAAEVGEGIIDGVGTEPVPDDQVRCAPGGVEGSLFICFDFVVAQSASTGARWIWRDGSGGERADLELDLRWEDWSAAADNVITPDGQEKLTGRRLEVGLSRHGFRDVLSVRLGGSYAIPVAGIRLIGRGGAAYDTAAAPDSWTRVDLDGKARLTLGTGLGLEIGRYRLDLGAGAVIEPTIEVEPCKPPHGPSAEDPGCGGDGEIPVRDRDAPDPQQPLQGKLNQVESPFNAGRYESGYRLFSFGLTASF
jgi:long-subunit fatty acid transport protein